MVEPFTFSNLQHLRRRHGIGGSQREELQAAIVAEEAGDEIVGGVGEQFLGRTVLVDVGGLAECYGDSIPDAIASSMSCVTNTTVFLHLTLQAAELDLQLRAHDGVDGTERLVHQEHW